MKTFSFSMDVNHLTSDLSKTVATLIDELILLEGITESEDSAYYIRGEREAELFLHFYTLFAECQRHPITLLCI